MPITSALFFLFPRISERFQGGPAAPCNKDATRDHRIGVRAGFVIEQRLNLRHLRCQHKRPTQINVFIAELIDFWNDLWCRWVLAQTAVREDGVIMPSSYFDQAILHDTLRRGLGFARVIWSHLRSFITTMRPNHSLNHSLKSGIKVLTGNRPRSGPKSDVSCSAQIVRMCISFISNATSRHVDYCCKCLPP